MIKYYMLVKKKRIISIFEFLMHDILKQPTYLSRLLRNLPRAAAWTSELYVLLLPWRKQQDLPKMALGVRMQINETCSISQIQNCLMRNFKIWSPSTRTDGRYTILCRYNDKAKANWTIVHLWLQFSTFLHTFCMHFCAFFCTCNLCAN